MNRTKILISISVILVAAPAMGALAADKPAAGKPAERSPEQKVLDLFVGNWKTTFTAAKAPGDPKAVSLTGTTSVVRAVAGRFTLNKSERSDGIASLAVATYDVQWKCYRMWWFDSGGCIAESQGRWDAKTKTMTWHRDSDDGVASVGKFRHLDDNTVKCTWLIKDDRGEIASRMEGKYTRVKQLPKRKAVPVGKKGGRSAEQKVLDAFVGEWKITSTFVKGPGDGKAVTLTSTASVVRAVGGRFIQNDLENSDGTSGLYLGTYDVRRKCYRWWCFDSQGYTSEFTGRWDAKTRTITVSAEQDHGYTAATRHRVVDNDTLEWSAETRSPDGKAVFQAKGKYTRVK